MAIFNFASIREATGIEENGNFIKVVGEEVNLNSYIYADEMRRLIKKLNRVEDAYFAGKVYEIDEFYWTEGQDDEDYLSDEVREKVLKDATEIEKIEDKDGYIFKLYIYRKEDNLIIRFFDSYGIEELLVLREI